MIADYGLAEFADSDEYLFMRCGTPGYVAPEIINLKDMKAKYKPIKKIGKGNFASVYLVESLKDQKQYAVKAFAKEAAYSEQKGK